MPPYGQQAYKEYKSAEQMLKAFGGSLGATVDMTLQEWRAGTDLGALSRRSSEMRGIDEALERYQLTLARVRALADPKSGQASLDGDFVRLKAAFDLWIRDHQRDGKNWQQSDRNKNGTITKLFNQITQVEAARSVRGMGNSDDWIARQAVVKAEQDALNDLFRGRTLQFKTALKTKLGVIKPVGGLAVNGLKIAHNGAQVVTPTSVSTACSQILGSKPPEELFQMLGVSFGEFCNAASTLLSGAAAPAKLLADIVKLGVKAHTYYAVSGARVALKQGAPEAALDAILTLMDDELIMLAKETAQHTAGLVAGAFGAAPIAAVANGIIDVMVNLRQYKAMVEEIKVANLYLARGNYSLELFNISPTLGCYFMVLADCSVWINFSVHDIGTPSWQDTVEKLRKKAEPAREKARSIIRLSKLAVSGTEGLNGLDWEPRWSHNKLDYLAANGSLAGVIGKIGQAIAGGGPAKVHAPTDRIVGQGGGA